MFRKVKSGSDEIFECDIDKDVAAEIVRSVTRQNEFMLSLLGHEKPNDPVKWAAECGPQSKQELPAAPLERLVGQESEKTRQEGIYFEFRDVIVTLKTQCPKSISYDSETNQMVIETENGVWSGLI